nr:MAG TPA: hypothetical protein [Caudoviricetes sp.]
MKLPAMLFTILFFRRLINRRKEARHDLRL